MAVVPEKANLAKPHYRRLLAKEWRAINQAAYFVEGFCWLNDEFGLNQSQPFNYFYPDKPGHIELSTVVLDIWQTIIALG